MRKVQKLNSLFKNGISSVCLPMFKSDEFVAAILADIANKSREPEIMQRKKIEMSWSPIFALSWKVQQWETPVISLI